VEWVLQLKVVVLLSRVLGIRWFLRPVRRQALQWSLKAAWPKKMMAGGMMNRNPMMPGGMKEGGMAKKKMMAGGGMMKKGYAAGGAVKKKMMAGGGAVRGK
jgi:hypothetical protein